MTEWDPRKISALRRYREAVQLIEDRNEEILRIRQRLYPGAQHISDMPGGGQKTDWTDTIADIIALEDAVKAEIAKLKDVRQGVMNAINSVADDRYRVMLSKRYIDGKTWERIAEEMDVEPMTIWRWHSVAINLVEI